MNLFHSDNIYFDSYHVDYRGADDRFIWPNNVDSVSNAIRHGCQAFAAQQRILAKTRKFNEQKGASEDKLSKTNQLTFINPETILRLL
jgi:hypothetical protein